MGDRFQPDLYIQLQAARLLGIWEVGARGGTADAKEEAMLGAGALGHRISPS